MEIISLIIALLGLIPICFLIKGKFKKRYKFNLDYKNITFAKFWKPTNKNLNGRLCLVVNTISIVNGSDESNTLKSIILSYHFNKKKYQTDSYVVDTGKLPKSGEPGIVLTNKESSVVLVGWENARTKLNNREVLNPGGVFSASAIFLFEQHITNAHEIQKLCLIVYDYYGNKSVHPITLQEEWYKFLNSGFLVINEPFMFNEDGSIELVTSIGKNV